jgi:hypothetical protein
MSVTIDCTSAPFVRCGKKIKLSSDGGDFGSKKCKLGYGGACGGFWRETALESGGRFCVSAIDRIPASVAVNVFLHVIYSVL